jgi:hypothetical protein
MLVVRRGGQSLISQSEAIAASLHFAMRSRRFFFRFSMEKTRRVLRIVLARLLAAVELHRSDWRLRAG